MKWISQLYINQLQNVSLLDAVNLLLCEQRSEAEARRLVYCENTVQFVVGINRKREEDEGVSSSDAPSTGSR